MKYLVLLSLLTIVTTSPSKLAAAIIETSSMTTSGIWSSPATWKNGTVPTSVDDVIITEGFTIYIDTTEVCSALSVTLKKFANMVFSPDGITGSTLTVSGNFTAEQKAKITMRSSNENDTFYLDVGGIAELASNNTFEICADKKNTKVTVNIAKLKILYNDEYGESGLTIDVSTAATINLSIQSLTIGEKCYFNTLLNSIGSLCELTSNENITIEKAGTFHFEVLVGSGILHISNMTNSGDFELYNATTTHVLKVDVGRWLNYGVLKIIGADPDTTNVNKPDPQNITRSVRLVGSYNNSYIISVRTQAFPAQGPVGAIMEHVAIERVGSREYILSSPQVEGYGIVFVGDGVAIDGKYDPIKFYNCDISSSADTGIFLKNCVRENSWWSGNGIFSNIIRHCTRAGVWFKNVTKSDIKNNKIHSNISENVGYGIRLESSNENEISQNDIYNNKIHGIYLENSNKNLVENNKVHDQLAEEGISLVSSQRNVLVGNECYNNPVHGISLGNSSNYNYISANKCYNNGNGGFRVRYNSNGNIFLINISSGNGRTGLASHSSVDTLCVDEEYRDNNYGDIYIEGEENVGYISQIWLKNCLLGSATEFTNTPEKQEFTKENSWVISQKHDRQDGKTFLWGQFSYPQDAHSWHTNNMLKFNFSDELYSGRAHGWNSVIEPYDTPMLRYDDGGIDGPSGTNDITSITTSSTTKTEVWIVTYGYGPNGDQWQVRGTSSGVQSNLVTHDQDYTSDNGEVRFRITHRTSPISPGEQYVFATIAGSKDKNTQKEIHLCDFSDPKYIGAKFENVAGGTVEFIGTPAAPTLITRKRAEDKTYLPGEDFYYDFILGGTINKIYYTSFSYVSANGLTFNSSPLTNTAALYITALQPNTTYSSYIAANNISHTFDNIYLDTINVTGVYNVKAHNAALTFRNYTRPFLPDNLTNSTIYWEPLLVWANNIQGFENDGVEPNIAERLSTREFCVKYIDLNNTPPTTVQVWIDLDDDLIFSPTEQFGLSPKPGVGNDNDYTNGEIYHLILSNIDYPPVPSVGRSGGKIKYRFYATNPYSITIATYTYNLYSVYNTVTSTYEATGIATLISTFSVKGKPPRCTVDTPSTEQSGLVTITYRLIDDDDKPDPYNYCSITVEYRNEDGSWQAATRANISESTTSLKASVEPGTQHTFIWDSQADLPYKDISTVIRITPTDEDGTGMPAYTLPFCVDNIKATKLTFITAEQNLETGTTSQVIIVEAQDEVGNRDVDVNGTIDATSTSTNYAFISATANVIITQLTMVAGKAEFRYCDNIAGFPTITVSTAGLQSASQIWTITYPVSPTLSTVSTEGGVTTYITASTVNVIVALRDINNAPVANKTVNIFVSGSNNYITQPADKTNLEGKAYASFWSTKAEEKVITAVVLENNLMLQSSATVTFISDVADKDLSSIYIPTEVVPINSTLTVTVTLLDKYLNPVPNKNITINLSPLRDTDIVVSTIPTNNNGVTYGYVYSQTEETKLISVTVQPPPAYITLSSTKSVTFKAIDLSPPTVVSVTPVNNDILTSPLNNISVIVEDTGDSEVSLSSTTLELYYYEEAAGYWRKIEGVLSYDPPTGGNRVKFTLNFNDLTTNGTYRIKCVPVDNANNVGETFISHFLINIRVEAPVIKTRPGLVSGIWNDINTWDPPQVPTSKENVEVREGFTLIIDTYAPCSALNLTLKDGAKLNFSLGTGQPVRLDVSEDVELGAAAEINIISTQPTNDVINFAARDVLLKNDNSNLNILLSGNNATANLSLRDVIFASNKNCSFNILITTKTSLSLHARNVILDDYNDFNITISSPEASVNLTISGVGEHGKLKIGKYSSFNTLVTAENSKITSTIDVIEVLADGHMRVLNSLYSSTITLTVEAIKVYNYGKLSIIGADPDTQNTIKPDPATTRRNIKVIASPTDGGYIVVKGDLAGALLYNAEFYGFGTLPKPGDESETYGITFMNNADFKVYNCNIWFGCVGIKIKDQTQEASVKSAWEGVLNPWEFGISSNVVHSNSTYGIWFENVIRNEIYNCIVSTTIDLGQRLRREEKTMGIGIMLENSHMNTIRKCDIYGNRVQGIFLYNSDKNLIEGNLVHHQNTLTGEEGIYLYNSNKNVIIFNHCYNNPVHGIALEYNSSDNYVGKNYCYNNRNGGLRVRYGANNNKFVTNFSTNNAYIDPVNPSGTGFTSHSSTGTLLVEEYYDNNYYGDIYIEGEENKGYVSQIWLKNCLLNSPTEFTNTPQKQEFTHPNSWVISQKHEGMAGLTRIWGNFTFPQIDHLWHTPVLKWNYYNQTYERFCHGWETTIRPYDTPGKRVDAGGGSRISSITLSSTTKSEIWIITYDANINRWRVRGTSSGEQPYLTPDTDYKTPGGEIGLRITHQAGTPKHNEEYVFITVADSKDGAPYGPVQKRVEFCDFSDPHYIGASFENKANGTVEIIGSEAAPTIFTRKRAEDKKYTPGEEFYYGVILGGTINKISNTSFSYLNSNGLTLNASPLSNTNNISITNLQPSTTYSAYISANDVTHVFDNVVIDTFNVTGIYNVKAVNSKLTFRSYVRPFLPDYTINSTIDWNPTLVFPGGEGFEFDGVEPDIIDRFGNVEFQVKYIDLNNVPPTTVQVWVDLDDDLIFSTTEQFGMQLKADPIVNDGDYSDGEVYTYILRTVNYPFNSVGRSSGRIKYRFYAENPYTFTIATFTYMLHSVFNTVTSTKEATGIATQVKTFRVKGTPPRISIITPQGKQSGIVPITYYLLDDDNKVEPYNYCSVTVEYYDPDTATWKEATRWVGSEDVKNLSSSMPPGTRHTFIWDTNKDLPNKDVFTAIRITPADEDGKGAPAQTGIFRVDNIVAEKLVFTVIQDEIVAHTTSQIIIIEAQDSANNKDIDANITLSLTSTSTDYNFVSATENVKIASVNMTFGEAKVRYCDNYAGNPTLIALYPGLQSAVKSIWVTKAVSVFLSSVTVVDTTTKYIEQVVGSTINVIITLKDISNEPVAGKVVTIAVSGSNNYITQPNPVTGKTNTEGQTFASFYSTKAELKTITATDVTDNLPLLSTATVLLLPDVVSLNTSTVTVSQRDNIIIGTTITLTAILRDKYLNPIPRKNVVLNVSPLYPGDRVLQPSAPTDIDGKTTGEIICYTPGDKVITVIDITDNITIDSIAVRYISPSEIDTTSPTVTSVHPPNGIVLTSPFTQITARLEDNIGGSGINLSSSTLRLFGPNNNEIYGVKATSGTDTIILTVPEQNINGIYRIEVLPVDNAGNIGQLYIVHFTLNVPTVSHEEVFKSSVFVYPNPVRNGEAKINFSLSADMKIKLQIYDITGELLWEEERQETAGYNKYISWPCKIQSSGLQVGSGVYIYKIIAWDEKNKFEVVKKIVTIQ